MSHKFWLCAFGFKYGLTVFASVFSKWTLPAERRGRKQFKVEYPRWPHSRRQRSRIKTNPQGRKETQNRRMQTFLKRCNHRIKSNIFRRLLAAEICDDTMAHPRCEALGVIKVLWHIMIILHPDGFTFGRCTVSLVPTCRLLANTSQELGGGFRRPAGADSDGFRCFVLHRTPLN